MSEGPFSCDAGQMNIDMFYCVIDRPAQITPLDVMFTPPEEEHLYAFDVTLVMLSHSYTVNLL